MNISKAVNDIWHNAEVAGEGELTLEPLLQAANRIADALERLADKAEEGEPAEATDPAQEQFAVQSAIARERQRIVMLVEEQFGPAPANRLSHELGLDQVPQAPMPDPERQRGDHTTFGFRTRVRNVLRYHRTTLAAAASFVMREMRQEQDYTLGEMRRAGEWGNVPAPDNFTEWVTAQAQDRAPAQREPE